MSREADNSPAVINQRSRVTLHFSLKLVTGELVDSNFDTQPASFTMGDGNLLAGFEQVLLGMTAGQQSSTLIPAEQAFGQAQADNIQQFRRHEIEATVADTDVSLEPGLMLSFADAANGELVGVVDKIAAETVEVNFNHPLAGKDIIFEVQVIEFSQT